MSLSYPRANRESSAGRQKLYQTYGPSLLDILVEICEIFKQPLDVIIGPARKEEMVCCKRIYCYVSCLLTDACLDDIGFHINKDHTTVMHHRHKVIQWKSTNDPRFMENWEQYTQNSKVWKQYGKIAKEDFTPKKREVKQELIFKKDGAFKSMYAAYSWLRENGYSYGSTTRYPMPVAIRKGIYDLPQKWHNLTVEEAASVDGIITSKDWREGEVKVKIYK